MLSYWRIVRPPALTVSEGPRVGRHRADTRAMQLDAIVIPAPRFDRVDLVESIGARAFHVEGTSNGYACARILEIARACEVDVGAPALLRDSDGAWTLAVRVT